MAKIAVAVSHALAERARNGHPGRTSGRVLARGEGWAVRDVICTCGPQDRSFEEQHSQISVAIVVAGSFQYRSAPRGKTHSELMIPGSVLLGNPGQYFECGHEHSAGDRCISFQFSPEYLDRVAPDLEVNSRSGFPILRIPPLPSLSRVVVRACATLASAEELPSRGSDSHDARAVWAELATDLAATASRLALDARRNSSTTTPNALSSVTRIVRRIESRPDSTLTLESLARESRLSLYHFLRTFELVTGVTPHQYIMRIRLRNAAARLVSEADKILDIALDCGFGDVSNFNHAFRKEFGVSPREYRRKMTGTPTSLAFLTM